MTANSDLALRPLLAELGRSSATAI